MNNNSDNNLDNNLKEEVSNDVEEHHITKPITSDRKGISKVFAFIKYYIFGQPDAYYETKKLLKATIKKIKKTSPLIYDTRKDKITPKFIRIIYEIYKIIHSAKNLMDIIKDSKKSKILQIQFIESDLTDEQRKILLSFKKENITKEFLEKGENKTNKHINKRENIFLKTFHKDKIFKIIQKYNALLDLVELISYDFYPLLKKANKDLEEDYLVENPSFSFIDGKYIMDELKALSDIIDSLDLSAPYKEAIEEFSNYKNKIIFSEQDVETLIAILKKMQEKEYLVLLIKYIDDDPFYRPAENKSNINIFQNYTKLLNSKIMRNIEYAKQEKLKVEVNSIIIELFGHSDINTLKNYLTHHNVMLNRFELGSYLFSDPLNYLRYFIMEKYNRYIRECINILIVEAKFYQSSDLKNLSSYFYHANELIKAIMKLDESLSENEPRGSRLKMLVRKSSGDSQSKKLAQEYIIQINNEADKILKSAVVSMKNLVNIIGKINKEAKNKGNYAVVANLREIQRTRNKEFLENLKKSQKDLILIIKLMTLYIISYKK